MDEAILFCIPRGTYKGKSEEEMSRAYTKMAIRDFDELVKFSPDYEPFKETPDYVKAVGKKEERDLEMSLFIQPIVKVGDLETNLKSWSYLFNPKSQFGLLPDLDVIHLRNGNVKDAADIIEEFYEAYGWKTYILEDKLPERNNIVKVNPKRNLTPGNQVAIMNPLELRKIAKEKLNYSLDELAFR